MDFFAFIILLSHMNHKKLKLIIYCFGIADTKISFHLCLKSNELILIKATQRYNKQPNVNSKTIIFLESLFYLKITLSKKISHEKKKYYNIQSLKQFTSTSAKLLSAHPALKKIKWLYGSSILISQQRSFVYPEKSLTYFCTR